MMTCPWPALDIDKRSLVRCPFALYAPHIAPLEHHEPILGELDRLKLNQRSSIKLAVQERPPQAELPYLAGQRLVSRGQS